MRYASMTALLFLLVAPASVLAGAEGAPAPSSGTAVASGGPSPPATLRFYNRDIVTFRATYFGSSPAERVAAAHQRLGGALAKGGPGRITIVKTAGGLSVTIDQAYVFRILDGDLDAEDGQTFEEAKVVVDGRLEEAIGAVKQARAAPAIVRGVALAAVTNSSARQC